MKHTFKEGFINFCQVCNTKKITEVIDLGHQPLADDLLLESEKNNPSISYPIKIYLCKKCMLLQNNYIVSDKKLYDEKYHYRPGISKTVEKNLENLAKSLIKLYDLKKQDLIVDLGCSDGTLLQAFKKFGYNNLVGVEPTGTYKFTKQKKINVINDFFNNKSANKLLKYYGRAKLVTTTNVFAHTGELKEFIQGLNKILKKDGIFVVENHYLKEIIEKLQFDSFYHEHLRTYSLTSLIKLMKYYKLNILDAYTTDRYNGNIQAHFSKLKNPINLRIKKILKNEKKSKLDKLITYEKFMSKIQIAKNDLEKFLNKNRKLYIVGKAFPARAAVILNYFSFLKNHIKFIAEQPTSLKLNHYVSGTNIKILNSNFLKSSKPDIIIVFAWHLFKEIKKKWQSKGLPKKTKYILLLPKFKIFN
ncbi:methyltransferase domain-containing protein [Candidatus Pelagibacter sp.]|nr:methyltransferase domain-containing protein [Candidatus Pelagibacter sp.]